MAIGVRNSCRSLCRRRRIFYKDRQFKKKLTGQRPRRKRRWDQARPARRKKDSWSPGVAPGFLCSRRYSVSLRSLCSRSRSGPSHVATRVATIGPRVRGSRAGRMAGLRMPRSGNVLGPGRHKAALRFCASGSSLVAARTAGSPPSVSH
jgi:hypothetical protein